MTIERKREIAKATDQVYLIGYKLDKLQCLVRNIMNDMESIGDNRDMLTAAHFFNRKDDYITMLDIILDYADNAQQETDKAVDMLRTIKCDVKEGADPVAVNQ